MLDALKCLFFYIFVALVLKQLFGTPTITLIGFYILIAIHELSHVFTSIKYNRFKGLCFKNYNPCTIISKNPKDNIKKIIIVSGLASTLIIYPILLPLFENSLQYLVYAFLLAIPDLMAMFEDFR